jgi:hypothetical protein
MPIINNYSFSDAVYSIPENASIPGEIGTATITISPLVGYTATAADFSLEQGFSNQYVQSVTFTQDGNNVLCTVTFVTIAVMPSANVTIPLCVAGSAEVAEITISGFFSANVGANVNGSPNESNTPFSNSGSQGEIETLFTKSYTADSGYYLATTGLQVVQGNQSNYNIIQTPTYDSENRLTSISYDVKYIYPSESISGDRLAITRMNASEIYNPLPKISGYIFDTSALSNPEQTRTLTVLGIPDTPFSATLNDGTTTTTIINNEVIGSKGTYNHDITFPALIKGNPNVTYTIEITGSYVADINLPNPFTVDQLDEVRITIDETNPPTPISGWPAVSPFRDIAGLTKNPFTDLLQSSGIWLIQLDYDITPFSGTGTFSVLKQIEISDFSNTEEIITAADGNQTSVTSLTVGDTTGILAGDKIALLNVLAPYESEVSSVDSTTTLTISPAITVSKNQQINFYRDNGNKIEIFNSDVTLVNSLTVNIKCDIVISNTGDTNTDFDLDLSNIISYTP